MAHEEYDVFDHRIKLEDRVRSFCGRHLDGGVSVEWTMGNQEGEVVCRYVGGGRRKVVENCVSVVEEADLAAYYTHHPTAVAHTALDELKRHCHIHYCHTPTHTHSHTAPPHTCTPLPYKLHTPLLSQWSQVWDSCGQSTGKDCTAFFTAPATTS